jgi:hypothetical protein
VERRSTAGRRAAGRSSVCTGVDRWRSLDLSDTGSGSR